MISSQAPTASGAGMSAHARAFAAPPRPHLAAATAVGGARTSAGLGPGAAERAYRHAAGAGRPVPPREEQPRVVRSTTRFL